MVVAGSWHEGIGLLQADTYFRANPRHAAARLVGLGRRHVAVLASAIPDADLCTR
jgi:hypothetical protein